ncbi:hypothetical protein Anapl_05856 [Anas platyrhynchos]|uniref:Uncharacterized protein n=1 Tax=Anas platyrhynchos TaxID=8839 RepID=R0M3C2_ANAPL|nr:hypothetical protein Anapl_05856 [Anas platyrhynchos]
MHVILSLASYTDIGYITVSCRIHIQRCFRDPVKTKTEDVEQGLMGKKVVSVFIHFWRRVKPAISALFWEALLPTPVSFISTRTLCPEELAVHQRDTAPPCLHATHDDFLSCGELLVSHASNGRLAPGSILMLLEQKDMLLGTQMGLTADKLLNIISFHCKQWELMELCIFPDSILKMPKKKMWEFQHPAVQIDVADFTLVLFHSVMFANKGRGNEFQFPVSSLEVWILGQCSSKEVTPVPYVTVQLPWIVLREERYQGVYDTCSAQYRAVNKILFIFETFLVAYASVNALRSTNKLPLSIVSIWSTSLGDKEESQLQTKGIKLRCSVQLSTNGCFSAAETQQTVQEALTELLSVPYCHLQCGKHQRRQEFLHLPMSESELSTANTKPCLLILRYGNIYLQAEIMTVLEEQKENLESKRTTKVVSQADQVKTTDVETGKGKGKGNNNSNSNIKGKGKGKGKERKEPPNPAAQK